MKKKMMKKVPAKKSPTNTGKRGFGGGVRRIRPSGGGGIGTPRPPRP